MFLEGMKRVALSEECSTSPVGSAWLTESSLHTCTISAPACAGDMMKDIQAGNVTIRKESLPTASHLLHNVMTNQSQ